jgi:hypothetical protein
MGRPGKGRARPTYTASVVMLPGDRIFGFRIPATHSEHSEKRPTGPPWRVVLLAV